MVHLGHESIEERIASAPRIEADPEQGLSSAQVEQRIASRLTNKTEKHVTKTYPQIIFDNFINFLNVVLFFVLILMIMARLKWNSYFFAVILFLNSSIGLVQDINARRLVDKLRVVSSVRATAIRDGKEISISANDIVLGDIIVYKAGDQILADSVVVYGEGSADESLLTGESHAIKKKAGENLFSGSFLVKGMCKARVEKVGRANYAETLQKKASEFSHSNSEIKTSVRQLMRWCCFIAIIIGVAMYVTYGLTSGEWLGFTKSDAGRKFVSSLGGSMVGMLPTGMFLLTSTTLAVGVIALARRRILVQELYCIEMLARVDLLCLDKTGTLTDGTMAVADVRSIGDTQLAEIEKGLGAILHFTGDENATAKALRARFKAYSRTGYSHVIPFDSEKKYSSVSLIGEYTYTMGAYGFVPAKKDERVDAIIKEMAAKGLRCIVLARSSKEIKNDEAPKGEIIGLIALSDHIKDDAPTTIGWFQQNKVGVRIISGDDPMTVSEIAKRCGVIDAGKCVSLEGVKLEDIPEIAQKYVVFGRVTPEQKAALINAFKKMGHKVAMTGDGVNDILALRVADCSIAMASGSSAARNVSHLVALDSDFSKLPDVVAQGRRVINNLQRTCSLFLCKTFFVCACSIAFLIASWFGGHSYPFVTPNLFVWEGFTIGVASFFLAMQPTNDPLRGSFVKNIMKKALPGGIAVTLGGLLPFLFSLFWPSLLTGETQNAFLVAQTMAVLVYTATSYVILFRVCVPLDKFRATVFLTMLTGGVAVFLFDYFSRLGVLSLHWDDFLWPFLPIALGILLVCAGTYVAFDRMILGKDMNTDETQKEKIQ